MYVNVCAQEKEVLNTILKKYWQNRPFPTRDSSVPIMKLIMKIMLK